MSMDGLPRLAHDKWLFLPETSFCLHSIETVGKGEDKFQGHPTEEGGGRGGGRREFIYLLPKMGQYNGRPCHPGPGEHRQKDRDERH